MNNSIFDLTNPQKAIWLTEQFYQGTNGNNVCGALFSNEKIDFELLKEAINIFVKTNDNFRIKIFIDKNTVKQFISDYEHFDIETILVNIASISSLNGSTSFNITKSVLPKLVQSNFINLYFSFNFSNVAFNFFCPVA